MDKLTKYLINNAEALIGNPIRPTEDVLAREDAPLYIWNKMGMSHSILRETYGDGWEELAPAAHLYVFNKEELEEIKPFVDRAYLELKAAIGSLTGSLWYLMKEVDGWHLYKGSDDFGTVDSDCEEVDYPADADAALSNLVVHLTNAFPEMCTLSKCIVLPYGSLSKSVWEYASKITLLGDEEADEFITNVVTPFNNGSETKKVTPRW